MRQFKTIESDIIPPGHFEDIGAFKEFVRDELDSLMKHRKEDEEGESQTNLPIIYYILYDDMSARRTMIFSRNREEKNTMVLAVKKQIRNPSMCDDKPTSGTPVYGAMVCEIFVAGFKVPKGLSPAAQKLFIAQLQEKHKNGEIPRETRILLQYEVPDAKQFDVRMFSILDPNLLVEQEEESKELTRSLNASENTQEMGLMASIFDYTPEQEIKVLGKPLDSTASLSLQESVEYVRRVLQNPTDQSA